GYLLLADKNVSPRRIRVQVLGGGGNCDLLLRGRNRELVVKHRCGSGNDNQHLRLRRKASRISSNGVSAERYGIEVKLTIVAGFGRHLERRIISLQGGMRGFYRVVLGVVHYPAYVPEYRGATRNCHD